MSEPSASSPNLPETRDAYAALRLPAVRRYIFGRFAWVLGTQMMGVAVGWQIYQRTKSMLALGLVGLVQVVPVIALALPAGQLIDRLNRRDVAIVAIFIQLCAVAAMTVFSLLDAPVWALYPPLFVLGIARTLGAPSTSALFTQLVPRSLLVNANAWRSSSFELASTSGPALAGGVIAWTGEDATWVYALNVAAVLSFLVVLFTLPRPPTPVPAAGAAGRDMGAGLRFVWNTELMLSAITLDMLAVLLGGATALLPVFAEEILHVGPEGLGWLRAAPSLGALAMALVTTRLRPWRHAGRALLYSVVGFGAATVVFGLSELYWLSWVMLFLCGAFDNISVIIRLTLEQLITPEALRGRVGAVHYVFIGLSNEMGELESGLVAHFIGPVLTVAGGGLGTLVVVGLVAWRWPALRKLGPLSSIRPAPTV